MCMCQFFCIGIVLRFSTCTLAPITGTNVTCSQDSSGLSFIVEAGFVDTTQVAS